MRAAIALFLLFAFAPAMADEGPYRFPDVERVVAFGDVHGAYDELVAVLRSTGVVDDQLQWQGGTTHLVSTGDLIDRGDDGRAVIALLMRLQREAPASGGAVHVLLGNHEVMNLVGDLRYVSAGDYAAFGGDEARRAAFAADGELGEWLLERPVMIVVGETAFVHGGVSDALVGLSLDEINSSFRASLDAAIATPSVEPTGFPFDADGPLWYRGNSLCHPYTESTALDAILSKIGARRIAVGHTVTSDHRITTRAEGRVVRIDTGMNHEAYGGTPSALVIEDGVLSAHYVDTGRAALEAEPNRVWDRPYGMSDEAIEAFLRDAPIVSIEEIGTGVTRPLRVTLDDGERRLHAVFKSVDTDPRLQHLRRWPRAAEFADRFVYDLVAYRLDRLLGLEMTPVSVLREIDGKAGALTYWLEDTFSENERRERQLAFTGHCALAPQYSLMNAFHVLVYNVDPNLGNFLYDADWRLWLIDHSRAFGTRRAAPSMIRRARIEVTPELDAALARLTPESLQELEEYLHPRQIEALLARARMLRGAR